MLETNQNLRVAYGTFGQKRHVAMSTKSLVLTRPMSRLNATDSYLLTNQMRLRALLNVLIQRKY